MLDILLLRSSIIQLDDSNSNALDTYSKVRKHMNPKIQWGLSINVIASYKNVCLLCFCIIIISSTQENTASMRTVTAVFNINSVAPINQHQTKNDRMSDGIRKVEKKKIILYIHSFINSHDI